jgi:hypothetical protein
MFDDGKARAIQRLFGTPGSFMPIKNLDLSDRHWNPRATAEKKPHTTLLLIGPARIQYAGVFKPAT